MPSSTSFYPKEYKTPEAGSNFLNLVEGDNKVRLLTEPVIGWEGWKDNKPFRRLGFEQNIEENEVDMDQKYGKPKINHFNAFMVFDYKQAKVLMLQINQKTIQKAIRALSENEDWGSPVEYDLTITRTEDGGRTAYSVTPSPLKALKADVQKIVDAADVSQEAVIKALSIED